MGALTIYKIYRSLSKRPSPSPPNPTERKDPIERKDAADLIDPTEGLLDPIKTNYFINKK